MYITLIIPGQSGIFDYKIPKSDYKMAKNDFDLLTNVIKNDIIKAR